jgi:hypothetical protein
MDNVGSGFASRFDCEAAVVKEIGFSPEEPRRFLTSTRHALRIEVFLSQRRYLNSSFHFSLIS